MNEQRKRALELLSGVPVSIATSGGQQWMTDVCAFLRALVAQSEQEPVAWMYWDRAEDCYEVLIGPARPNISGATPLYAQPQQATPAAGLDTPTLGFEDWCAQHGRNPANPDAWSVWQQMQQAKDTGESDEIYDRNEAGDYSGRQASRTSAHIEPVAPSSQVARHQVQDAAQPEMCLLCSRVAPSPHGTMEDGSPCLNRNKPLRAAHRGQSAAELKASL